MRSRRRAGLPWRNLRRGALVAACCLLVSFGLARGVAGGTDAVSATVTVAPGDTLWSIAARRYPSDDTRERVDEIMSMNSLASPVIEVGEALKVPAG
jgi:LysM domain